MELLWAGPDDAPTLVLAHGAGAAMDSPWMERMASLLADRGIRTARFEFAYMAARRQGRRPPALKAELVMGEFTDAVAEVRRQAPGPLWLGGKSYGGRVASLIADDVHAAALVCLGYPFHPPEKPEQLRTAHLAALRTPTLICQGRRDPFGSFGEVEGYALSESIRVEWFDGQHDIGRPPLVADAVAEFLHPRPR